MQKCQKSVACSITILVTMMLALVALPTRIAHAGAIAVNSVADAVDIAPGDGQCLTSGGVCTLRAAIQEANALPGADTIMLPPGNYTLTIIGGDDVAANGDLDITDSVTIIGAGRNATIIDAAPIGNRIFETWNNLTTANISHLTLRNGRARTGQSGGGILNRGQLALSDVVVSNNTAIAGGGIDSLSGAITLTDVTLRDNQATSGTGGGLNISAGTAAITGSTFSGNRASGGAGGIGNAGSISVLNSTLSGNNGDGGGGIGGSGSITIANSTIAGNSSDATTSGGVNTTGTVAMHDTILAQNIGGVAPDCGGSISSQGYNLLGNNTGCTITPASGDQVGTAGSPLDPHLGSLQDNGGATFTRAPLPGSPAIDRGNACASIDQIGTIRPQGRSCDIGAVEVFPVPSITTLSPPAALVGDVAFTLTVSGANFASSARVLWNGADRPTTFVSSTELQVQISAADIGIPGTDVIVVVNPTPGGGSSNQVTFVVNSTTGNPVPRVDSLNPATVRLGTGAFSLVVKGAQFVDGARVRWNGADRPTIFVSSSELAAAIGAADVAAFGTANVTVVNPGPGGGSSNPRTFTIGSTVILLPMVAIARAPLTVPLCNDVEPANDVPKTAPLLNSIGQTCAGSFSSRPGDTVDLYKIVLSSPKTISIELSGIPAQGDDTLALYDYRLGSDERIAPLCVSKTPGQANEHIVFPSTVPSTYYIGIFLVGRSPTAANSYLLSVTLQNQPAACSPPKN